MFRSLFSATMSTAANSRPTLPYVNPLPRSSYPATITYPPSSLTPYNTRPDSEFYSHPRFVQHIDDATIAELKRYYSSVLKEGEDVVDLCSSWTSHLPLKGEEGYQEFKTLIGIGMNQSELDGNPLLTTRLVHDLNTQPSIPLPTASIDSLICSVSIDYLTSPIVLLTDIARVLKPNANARIHLAFGDRCFPDKVIREWLNMGHEERRKWVGGYFWAGENEGKWKEVEEVILRDGRNGGDKLFVVRAVRV